MHPALECTESFIESESSIDDFRIVEYDEIDSFKPPKHEYKTCRLPYVGEWATSPPVTRIAFDHLGPGGEVEIETGITVLDFLQAVAETWSELVPDELVLDPDYTPPTDRIRRFLLNKTYEDAVTGKRRINWAEWQTCEEFNHHRFWEGWRSMEVLETGDVVLSPCYYGS